ncbi:sphingomyelin phosphodiesterase-like [Corticium candelabrum]|uniref:sphingomyelin phosphodiesterase-like n=1 Tax=Corticium candelabrum TaxID=121492 RepID=UPI002E25D90C|nr:sphingomyelin phosphodiesterase-like [Corticium candelabrum]
MMWCVCVVSFLIVSCGLSSSTRLSRLSDIECDVCKLIVPLIQSWFDKNSTEDEVAQLITDFCIDFQLEDRNVCIGIVKEFRNEVLTVAADGFVSSNTVCGLIFGDSCAIPDYPPEKWNVSLPSTPKPPVKPHVPPQPDAPVMHILHLSDVHFDEVYTPGLDTDCGEPLCCRPPNKYVGPTKGAGKWGSYACDVPRNTIENLLQHISASVKFDFIYWTGDLPAHNVWNQSRSDQLRILNTLVELMLKYFPGKLVFPAVGNHESAPVNSYPPPFVTGKNSNSWLLDALAVNWSHWLPKDTQETIRYGGYYTVKVRPGWRIISLNMNYCQSLNFWLYINSTDPAQELAWLIKQLQEAEDVGDKVHILGHQPVSSCMSQWKENYYEIVNRYESTIAGHFFGHTHSDQFHVFFDKTNMTRATNIMYVGPSVTTYQDFNPSYRIYELDGQYNGSSYYVLDHATYILNLTEANLSDKPQWQFEYSAKAAYGMKTLYPQDWADLLDRMKANSTLQDLYNKFYHHSVSHATKSCDVVCRSAFICEAENLRQGTWCKRKLHGVSELDILKYRSLRNVC